MGGYDGSQWTAGVTGPRWNYDISVTFALFMTRWSMMWYHNITMLVYMYIRVRAS